MSVRAIKKLEWINQSNKEGSQMNPKAYQCMDHVVLEKPGKVPKQVDINLRATKRSSSLNE